MSLEPSRLNDHSEHSISTKADEHLRADADLKDPSNQIILAGFYSSPSISPPLYPHNYQYNPSYQRRDREEEDRARYNKRSEDSSSYDIKTRNTYGDDVLYDMFKPPSNSGEVPRSHTGEPIFRVPE